MDNINKKYSKEEDGIISMAMRGIEKFYLKLEKCKRDYKNEDCERSKTIKTIQNINRLDLSCGVKHELESMLYSDLEDKDKYKFFSN